MIVYEIPVSFTFPEGFNSHNGCFFSTLLGVKTGFGLWAIYKLSSQEIEEVIPYPPRELNTDVYAFGYKRTFLTTKTISQVEEYLLAQKDLLSIDS